MTWRYKKGDEVYVVLPGKVLAQWGTNYRPLYQIELEIKDGTQSGVKKIKVDVAERRIEKQSEIELEAARQLDKLAESLTNKEVQNDIKIKKTLDV